MPRNPKTKIADPAAIRRPLHAWFRRHGRDLPWRRDPSPYAVLVSEFMLQQTQVVTVVPYFERWMKRFPDFQQLAAATEEEVLSHWQGLGYYSRARRLHQAAIHVCKEHSGLLPPALDIIAALPGVGRYTAGAIASFAFDLPVATVDGNIARVLARLTDTREPIDSAQGQAAIWKAASDLLPARGGRIHTSALMELGALVCTSRSPQCLICPIRTHCTATEPEALPRKRPRAATVELNESCGWVIERGRILLEQQTGSRWKGLWKLPRIESESADRPLFQSTYPFTNHRVNLRVHQMSPPPRIKSPLAWQSTSEIASIPLAAPHRRAILHLLDLAPPLPSS